MTGQGGWIATPVAQARNDDNVGCGLAIDKMSQSCNL